MFLFQRWQAEASLNRDGCVLHQLVAWRVGRLHPWRGAAASCPPIVVGCVLELQPVPHTTGYFYGPIRYYIKDLSPLY
jgi:hypothetical protein